jgi:membrane-associated phospholipid phosphatase
MTDSSNGAEVVGCRHTNPSLRKHDARQRPGLWFFVAFAAVYLLAVWTGIGQSAENALIVGRADQARIFEWRQWVPPLTRGTAVLAAGVLLILAVTLMRRCWREGVAAVAIVVATFGATEALHAILPRPSLSPAPQALSGASFPSGTVAIAAGLALGVAVVSSPRARPYVAAAGAIWLAVITAAVQTLYWHRPSDVLGATLLACACHAMAKGLLAPVGVRRLRALPPLAFAAAGALLASTREESVARPLVFAGVALVCSTLLWITATGVSVRIAPRRGLSLRP